MTGNGACCAHVRHPPPTGRECAPDDRLRRGNQYAAACRFHRERLWNTGSPAFAGDDSFASCNQPYAAGTGSAVTDFIFSIAKRDVTFFSGTALISFL